MKRSCVQCGNEFILTQAEINFYKSHGLALPKRCKQCREKNKQMKASGSEASAEKKAEPAKALDKSIDSVKKSSSGFPRIAVIIAVILAVILGGGYGLSRLGGKTETEPTTSAASSAVTEAETETEKCSEDLSALTEADTSSVSSREKATYSFRNNDKFIQHFEKHGAQVGAKSADEYLEMANALINDPNALNKITKDGDTAYYLESTHEFAVVSDDGYLRTYYLLDEKTDEEAMEYFEKQ